MRFFLRRESTAEPVGCQAAASFTGALQPSPLDVTNIATGWGGNPTMSLTTGTANDLVTATLSRFGTTGATTNRTSLYNSTASSTLGAASYQIAGSALLLSIVEKQCNTIFL
jgi:hypothetical protein